jgi:VIT1/CCC1 family predicted Fe2+/Mn2+ transporter
MVDRETRDAILAAQRNEITEHIIYKRLSRSVRDPHNRKLLERIAGDELEHHDFWKRHTNKDVKPDRFKIWTYLLISRVFGITFGIKLMERGEGRAEVTYENLSKFVPDAKSMVEDEDQHERELIDLIDEEWLRYVGSIVLGLNDALVELTGVLAGLTLALQNTRLVAMTGFITGIAASLSMSASEYLSTKSEEGPQDPLKASIYTGSAYVLTVLFLIFPYLLFMNY